MDTTVIRVTAPPLFGSELPRSVFVWLEPGEYAELMAYLYFGTVDFEV